MTLIETVILTGLLLYLIWYTYDLKRDLQTIKELKANIARLEAKVRE
jgi:hypothetical protein